jgi:hypothetical protein
VSSKANDKLSKYLDDTKVAYKDIDQIDSQVIAVCSNLENLIGDFTSKSHKEQVFSQDDLLHSDKFKQMIGEGEQRTDREGKSLLEAFVKYHSKRLSDILNSMARELSANRFSKATLDRREVRSD